MGVDIHGLNFLRLAHRAGDFGETCMIGRQNLHVSPAQLQTILGGVPDQLHATYAEPLLAGAFGATKIESIDYSDYEHATMIHDMNRPVGPLLEARFDTILDLGTLEHVFEITTALKNLSRMVRPGGQILHVLPANNMSGHGFWQMAPELFFSLYSPKNGYRDTAVFLAELNDTGHWLRVTPPRDGRRISFRNRSETYVMVRTVRDAVFSHETVLQSDYVASWEDHQPHTAGMAMAGNPGLFGRLVRSLRKRMTLSAASPFLTRVAVGAAIAEGVRAARTAGGATTSGDRPKNVA